MQLRHEYQPKRGDFKFQEGGRCGMRTKHLGHVCHANKTAFMNWKPKQGLILVAAVGVHIPLDLSLAFITIA